MGYSIDIDISRILRKFKQRISRKFKLPRKEMFHPQLPLRMPCYDFTLVTELALETHNVGRLGHSRLPWYDGR